MADLAIVMPVTLGGTTQSARISAYRRTQSAKNSTELIKSACGSPTGRIEFNNCHIQPDPLVGQPGQATKILMQGLNWIAVVH